MQMSLSGFLTFIYPYAQHYSRVENYKLRRKVLRLLNQTQKRKKKKQTQKFSACPKSLLLTAIMALWNTLFLLVYSSESPTAPCQGRNLDLCCALSPKLRQNLPVSTCMTLLLWLWVCPKDHTIFALSLTTGLCCLNRWPLEKLDTGSQSYTCCFIRSSSLLLIPCPFGWPAALTQKPVEMLRA